MCVYVCGVCVRTCLRACVRACVCVRPGACVCVWCARVRVWVEMSKEEQRVYKSSH